MVSKLLKGRGLWLQVMVCKSFPTVYLRLRRFVDRGKMTYNSYMLLYVFPSRHCSNVKHCKRIGDYHSPQESNNRLQQYEVHIHYICVQGYVLMDSQLQLYGIDLRRS